MSLATRIAQEINSVRSEVVQAPSPAQPFSGYAEFNEIENNFVFKEDANFLASIADKNKYVKFGDKVVDTYGDVKNDRVPQEVPDSTVTDYGHYVRVKSSSVSNQLCVYVFNESIQNGETVIIDIQVRETDGVNFDLRWNGVYDSTDAEVLTDLKQGVISKVYKNNTGVPITHVLVAGAGANAYAEIDKFEIRSVQTYNGTQHIPEVIVQDQATDGLNVQQSVSQGEFVVVDRENKVPNGTFDTEDLSSFSTYNGSTASIVSGELVVDTVSVYGVSIKVVGQVGTKYKLDFSLLGTEALNVVRYSSSDKGHSYIFTISDNIDFGKNSFTYTANHNVHYIWLESFHTDITYILDNISVKQVDETYRAIQDAPSGTALTDTNYFELNDDRPLTNPVLVAHTMNDLTKAYEGLTGEVLFNDPVAGESTKSIMTKNGYSVVSKGLYSKGTKLYLVMGYYSGLNKGAYHPFVNPFGTNGVSNSSGDLRSWYEPDGRVIASVADSQTFPDIGDTYPYETGIVYGQSSDIATGISKHPQSKYYDIIYSDQFVDLREYSFRPNQITLDRMIEDKERHGVSSMVGTYGEYNCSVYDTNRVLFSNVPNEIKHLAPLDDDIYYVYNDEFILMYEDATGFKTSKVSYLSNTSGNIGVRTLGSGILGTFTGVAFLVYKVNINSSATKLSTDLIGSPDNYPQILKDRLAEGKTVFGINPLLVNQDGTSAVDVNFNQITCSEKMKSDLDNVLYTVGTETWTSWVEGANAINEITNKCSSGGTSIGYLALVNYTSSNPAYTQADPLPVLEVQPKVIATNSHSIHLGANVGNSNGYIQVGNGVNGLESRVLENSEIPKYDVLSSSGMDWSGVKGDGVWYGTILHYDSGTDVSGNPYGFYVYLGGYIGTVNVSGSLTLTEANDWYRVDTTPQHPTLSLDNSTAIANKYFRTIAEEDGELVSQVFMESMEWDFDADSEPEFIPVTSEDTLYAYVKDSLYLIGMVDNVGLHSYTLRCLYTGTYRLKYLQKSGSYWLDDSGVKMFEDWDGNGFGDNGEFEQLTNGTNIDLNGNTTRTFVGKISLGVNK